MEPFEEKMKDELQQEVKLSPAARRGFDQAYQQIRQQPQNKKVYWGTIIQLAAVGLLIVGGIWHKPVVQALQQFFGFGQFESEKVQKSDFVSEKGLSVTDQGIQITTEAFYRDASEIGFKLRFDFLEHQKEWKKADDFNMLFRVRNDEDYLFEFISDTKELKGTGDDLTFKEIKELDTDGKKAEYIVKLVRGKEPIPTEGDLQLEIETINLFSDNNQEYTLLKQIEGQWDFELTSEAKASFETIFFDWESHPEIEILKAEATATGLAIEYRYDENHAWTKDYLEGIHTFLTDEQGKEYHSDGRKMEVKDGMIYVNVVYPYTAYDEKQSLNLHFDGAGLDSIALTMKK